jgi:hypothetical protein
VAKELKFDVDELKRLIEQGVLRMAVLSAEVEEISNLSDPLLATAWYGREDPLDYFIDASGLNLPKQDRKGIDLSESATGMHNAKNVETNLLADLPKYLYLKTAKANRDDESSSGDITRAKIEENEKYQPDKFEIFSGELVRIVFIEDVNFLLSTDEPEYRRKVLSINISEPVISREEKERFMAEYYVEEKPLKESERENLLKLIGILSHSFAKLAKDNGVSKFLLDEKVNSNQIAEEMNFQLDCMDVADKSGITVETNKRKISEGIKLLESAKLSKPV